MSNDQDESHHQGKWDSAAAGWNAYDSVMRALVAERRAKSLWMGATVAAWIGCALLVAVVIVKW
jgi:hypothetical protein